MIDLIQWRASAIIAGNNSIKADIFRIIAEYFLFKNIELKSENSAVIVQAIYEFCRTKPKFKVYDLGLALVNGRVNLENNISAAHIIGLMETYCNSEERKQFLRTLENDVPKLEPVKLNDENILKLAKENLSLLHEQFKKTGKVILNMSEAQFDALVNGGYFKFIKESKEELNKISLDEHIKEKERELLDLPLSQRRIEKNKIDVLKYQIKYEKFVPDDMKIIRRKYILKLYFKKQK